MIILVRSLTMGIAWGWSQSRKIDLGVEGRMKGRRASGIRSGDGIKYEPCYPRMLPLTAAPGVVASKPCVWLQPAALALSRTDSAL